LKYDIYSLVEFNFLHIRCYLAAYNVDAVLSMLMRRHHAWMRSREQHLPQQSVGVSDSDLRDLVVMMKRSCTAALVKNDTTDQMNCETAHEEPIEIDIPFSLSSSSSSSSSSVIQEPLMLRLAVQIAAQASHSQVCCLNCCVLVHH
jgi:hypothetical protein